jgi:serine/threonine protein kinase
MNPERPSAYEQLSPEAAARVDAVCDGFEKAWRAARAGAAAPRLSSFLDGCDGPERTVLAEELLVLERACRERYGYAAGTEEPRELAAGAWAPTNLALPPLHRLDVSAGRSGCWPSVPGLELVDVLGSGGMGVVFKARQAKLDRDVAVKFLRDDHRADSGRRERFLLEARAVARLRHPNLVQVYEFGEVPVAGGATSQPYLVLEYVSGGSLVDLLRGAPQPPREAAQLVETLANAIHYAHQQGVIHRDLKPANVLLQRVEVKGEEQTEVIRGPRFSPPRPLTADLCPKVTDFGLAKFLAGSDLTHTGDVLGTPSYMAPEQAASKLVPITAAVDVYGLGAILYEALTGRPPFAAVTIDATLGLVRQDEPVPPRRLQPTVPRDLETICLKCLRKEPGRRYATAQDLADDLRRFQAGEPVLARPVGTVEWVVVWCRRRPGVAGLLGALLLVFLAGSAGVLWQWQRASRNAAAFRRERDTARQEKQRAERRLEMVRKGVDRLNRLGRELLGRPRQYRTGKAVLEQALAFYQDMLPEEGSDPRVRREAAQLFRQVANIHSFIGQRDKAAQAYGRRARLLTSLLREKPGDKALRFDLANTQRSRGNQLRDLRKARQAREAYDQAARLYEGLRREFPNEAGNQMLLANTLINTATLLSPLDQVKELEVLYRRALKLNRAAVRAEPGNAWFKAELALGLESQGLFFLDTERGSQAEAAVRKALAIHKRLLAGGRMKGYIETYVARNFVSLGKVLATTGKGREAEKQYRAAVKLLDRFVKDLPLAAFPRSELALTLANQANFLKEPDRRQEAEGIRRRVIHLYETLLADSPEDPEANNSLAWCLATNPEPRLRNPARAVRLAKKAVAAGPQSPFYQNTLAVAHFRNGHNKAAVAALKTAMRLRGGGDSFDWFILAMAHWRLGHRETARRWFDRAVQWMDRHKPHDDDLRRFRAEAKALLAEASKG